MFKVSFKETPQNPSKLVTKMGNETTVILKGICDLPAFFEYIPKEISEWIEGQRHIEGYEDIASNQLIIYSKGIARCHPEDKYDSILGERMAESRAKELIYQFFFGLCSRFRDYYCMIVFGDLKCNAAKVSNDSLTKALNTYKKLWEHEKQYQIELSKGKNNGK